MGERDFDGKVAVVTGGPLGMGKATARRLAQGGAQVVICGRRTAAVDEAIAEHADAADKVRAGNLGTIGFLVGQVMKKTRGQANPGMVNELLRQKLS